MVHIFYTWTDKEEAGGLMYRLTQGFKTKTTTNRKTDNRTTVEFIEKKTNNIQMFIKNNKKKHLKIPLTKTWYKYIKSTSYRIFLKN